MDVERRWQLNYSLPSFLDLSYSQELGGFIVKNDGRGKLGRSGKAKRKGDLTDAGRFKGDRNKYSLLDGNSKYISRARQTLEEMDGGLDLLMSLVSFDPEKRATASDVLNSCFMEPLREAAGEMLYNPDDTVYSYNAFSTHY
jgi:hypothetical protein